MDAATTRSEAGYRRQPASVLEALPQPRHRDREKSPITMITIGLLMVNFVGLTLCYDIHYLGVL